MRYEFPSDFAWGISMSAFQTEGAWNIDGKGPSIWDDFCHSGHHIADGSNADVACDFYHKYREDIALMASLGIKVARFSVSWPRIFPEGYGRINEQGLRYYQDVASCMREHGIEPLPVLFHWDLPSALMKEGGYSSEKFPRWFTDYAETVIEALSSYAEKFITINQPYSVFRAVSSKFRAPALGSIRDGFIAASNCLLAHGMTVRMVRKRFPEKKVGIVLNLIDFRSATENEKDIKAASFQNDLTNMQFLLPLFRAEYPESVIEEVGRLGIADRFSDEDNLSIISSPMDFIGINYYQRMTVVAGADPYSPVKIETENTEMTDGGRDIVPESLATVIRIVASLAPDLDIYITENGADYRDEGPDDWKRIDYLYRHLVVVSELISEGYHVKGYMLWTLMDNFEWENGYEGKYGIFMVDKNLRRIAKRSAIWYSDIINMNTISDGNEGAICHQ